MIRFKYDRSDLNKLTDSKNGFALIKAKMSVKATEKPDEFNKFYNQLVELVKEQTDFADEYLLQMAIAESLDAGEARVGAG